MGGSGVKIGDTTTSQTRGTRGTRGDSTKRGDGTTRGACAGRWEAVAWGEAMQQPARGEA